ncbi:MAG: hypothetical protein DHS20C14_17990 [Phycisphaeraceae bacterium]|nr:MAG: hypothetical protein DHS20C14_17990 [Phycisphaeraceae bacterium]
MAKKPASKKKTTKTTRTKSGAAKTSARTPAKRPSSKKPTVKKTTKKKTIKKTTKKPAASKTASKKTTKKKTAKTAAGGSKKAPVKKAPTKKAPASKKTVSKVTKKTAASKAPAKNDPKSKAAAAKAEADAKKSGRKGITIVSDKPQRRPRSAPPKPRTPPPGPRLLGPGAKLPKPLIPSGPSLRGMEAAKDEGEQTKRKKTPFNKRQLDAYRTILLTKRAELIGDVTQMESDALRSEGGGLSNTPQHMAEQGSESADQSLSLNLAAADRRLIKEIDAALERIADRTFGLCELTGEEIAKDRLEELPWARYSIEAARQLESRGGLR